MDKNDASIIKFPVEGVFSYETAEDSAVLEQFMSRLVHPAYSRSKTRTEFAHMILGVAGTKPPDDLSDDMKHARDRIVAIRFATTGLSDDAYDGIIDPLDERYDEGFASLYDALLTTRENVKEFDDERSALRVMMELRVAALRLGLHDSYSWKRVGDILTSDRP